MSGPFVKGNYYHLYNRGWNKGEIFFSHENYIHLLKKKIRSLTRIIHYIFEGRGIT